MRLPSIKTLTDAFGAYKAKQIRAIMEGEGNNHSRLERIDTVLGNFGVEYIPAGRNSKSPAIYYSNSGDTYRTTVLLVSDGWLTYNFRVGCWGDIVERGSYE